jgi:hypothetical protein
MPKAAPLGKPTGKVQLEREEIGVLGERIKEETVESGGNAADAYADNPVFGSLPISAYTKKGACNPVAAACCRFHLRI